MKKEFETIKMSMESNPHNPEERTIALLTLNRPHRLNATSPTFTFELDRAMDILRYHPTARVLIITGAGRAFCSGGDLKIEGAPQGASGADADASDMGIKGDYRLLAEWMINDQFHRVGQQAYRKLETLPIPTIAAVNGWAVGGGVELATACDIRIGSKSTRFSENAVSMGFLSEWGGTWNLPKIVGPGFALEMMYTSRVVEAQEAFQRGLLNHVVEDGDLIKFTMEMAGKIATASPMSIRWVKKLVKTYLETGNRESAREMELASVFECSRSDAARIGSEELILKTSQLYREKAQKP